RADANQQVQASAGEAGAHIAAREVANDVANMHTHGYSTLAMALTIFRRLARKPDTRLPTKPIAIESASAHTITASGIWISRLIERDCTVMSWKLITPQAAATPTTPPTRQTSEASVTTSARICQRRKPSVRIMPSWRVRSRTDIETVLATLTNTTSRVIRMTSLESAIMSARSSIMPLTKAFSAWVLEPSDSGSASIRAETSSARASGGSFTITMLAWPRALYWSCT